MSKRNQNRPGYKKTKIGWIPEDWEVKSLGSLGFFSKGKGISINEKRNTGSPCVTYGEIYTTYDIVVKETKSFIDTNTAASRKSIKKNDLLFAGSGETLDEIGKCVAYINDEKAYAGGDIIILTPEQEVDSTYLSYSLNSNFMTRYRRKLGQGHSVVHIYSSGLKKLYVPIPSLTEQMKIAEILLTWERMVEQIKKLIKAMKKLKKGLMQQLLNGRMRFPVFGKPVYCIGEIPEGWRELKLDNVSKIRRGASPRPIADNKWFAESGRGWIRISDVTGSSMNLNKTSQYMSNAGVDRSVKVEPGDLILSICATIGVPVIVNIKACIHDGFVVIRGYEKIIELYFLYYSLSLLTDRLSNKGQPGTQKNLNTTIVGNQKIKIPTIDEQRNISGFFINIDKEIDELNKKANELKKQKKGLMQKLLTGELRVISNKND